MQIQVLSSTEKTTKMNRPFKSLEVFAENEKRRVNIFSSAPDFANIKQGSTIMGNMTKNGDYWEITFDGGEKSRPTTGSTFKQKVIEETMTRKENSIGKFQDDKEFSIMVSSTMRDAVQLAVAEYTINKQSLDRLDECVLKWRRFLLENWNLEKKDIPPF